MSKLLKQIGLLLVAGAMAMLSAPVWSKSADEGETFIFRHRMMWGGDAGYEVGRGMMSFYGMGPYMVGWGNYLGLKLTPEQKAKMAEIRQQMRKQHWELMEKMMVEREKLQELYEAESPDQVAIEQQHDRINMLHREMRKVAYEGRMQMDAVLTKEQREKARRWGRGYHIMMWGY